MRSWHSVELSSEAIRTRRFVGSCALPSLLLGLHGLAAKGLGLDEAASAGFALHTARTWFADKSMALSYALLAGGVRCFGHGEFALRSLSVLYFVATVPAMYALAIALFDARTARVATLLYVSLRDRRCEHRSAERLGAVARRAWARLFGEPQPSAATRAEPDPV